jgi:hypothetical protein
MKKIIIIAVVVLVILGAGVGLYLKNKKVEGLENTMPSYTISATQLFEEFAKDETAALNKFRNKILLVEGIIQDTKPVNDSVASILLRADDSGLGTIKCGLGKEYANAVKTINIEETVKIKGVCSGVSKVEDFGITIMDIELSRCVIVK